MGVNSWINPKNPKYSLNNSKSFFYNINIAEQKISFFNGYSSIITGLGFNFNQFSFKGPTLLSFNKDSTWALTNDDYKFKKNKLNVSYITMPLMLEFNTNLDRDKSFHIAFGVLGGFKLFSKTKQQYEYNGDNYLENISGHYNINPWKADIIARIGYGNLTLFGNYSLTQFFENNAGPKIYTYQVGLRLIDF